MSNDEHQRATLYGVAGEIEGALDRLLIPHVVEVLEEGDGVMPLPVIRLREIPVDEEDRVRSIVTVALDGAPIPVCVDTI